MNLIIDLGKFVILVDIEKKKILSIVDKDFRSYSTYFDNYKGIYFFGK